MRPRQIYGAILKSMSLLSGRIKSDDDRRGVGSPRIFFVGSLLADWGASSPEPVLGNVALPSGRLKSDSNRRRVLPLLIPEANGTRSMRQRQVCGALL